MKLTTDMKTIVHVERPKQIQTNTSKIFNLSKMRYFLRIKLEREVKLEYQPSVSDKRGRNAARRSRSFARPSVRERDDEHARGGGDKFAARVPFFTASFLFFRSLCTRRREREMYKKAHPRRSRRRERERKRVRLRWVLDRGFWNRPDNTIPKRSRELSLLVFQIFHGHLLDVF